MNINLTELVTVDFVFKYSLIITKSSWICFNTLAESFNSGLVLPVSSVFFPPEASTPIVDLNEI